MKARHRIASALFALTSLTGLTAAVSAPATAAVKIAGTGYAKTNGTMLNMRTLPSASAAVAGRLPDSNRLLIVCQVRGQSVSGTVRTTNLWDKLVNGYWVADAYVSRAVFPIPTCPSTSAPRSWMRPVNATLVSGFRTPVRPAHDGVDLGAARNTPIRAATSGTVIRVVCNASTNNCDVDGSRSVSGCGWYVEVQHALNYVTRYCHMVRRPSVVVGQRVVTGQLLGFVGSSGSSSGPHLHFEVHAGTPATRANAVDPIRFMIARGAPLG
ncbi:peptidoglycan DD-metalloendopeptidase family protein [Actinoplanes sp. NPDC051633]|uniref:M23 family metallopeptidase n=1 Tax=Actinoplanes sp. NPDC051633 TaxID=3155670 RepID=UPI00343DE693